MGDEAERVDRNQIKEDLIYHRGNTDSNLKATGSQWRDLTNYDQIWILEKIILLDDLTDLRGRRLVAIIFKQCTNCSLKAVLMLTNPRFCSKLTVKQTILSLRDQQPETVMAPPEETSIPKPPRPGSFFFFLPLLRSSLKEQRLCYVTLSESISLSLISRKTCIYPKPSHPPNSQWQWQIPTTLRINLTHTHTLTNIHIWFPHVHCTP